MVLELAAGRLRHALTVLPFESGGRTAIGPTIDVRVPVGAAAGT
jgi:hypothetical protein